MIALVWAQTGARWTSMQCNSPPTRPQTSPRFEDKADDIAEVALEEGSPREELEELEGKRIGMDGRVSWERSFNLLRRTREQDQSNDILSINAVTHPHVIMLLSYKNLETNMAL